MNNVDDFNNNNIVAGNGPEFKWQKKVYIVCYKKHINSGK